jgi:hypothetical protein
MNPPTRTQAHLQNPRSLAVAGLAVAWLVAACSPERDRAAKPAAAGQAAVAPAQVAAGGAPEAPAVVEAEVRDLTFLPVTGAARRFALTGVPGGQDLAAIHAVPGLTVLEKPGGHGPVDVSWHDPRAAEPGALAALAAAGVSVAGEVFEFVLRRPAGMATNCPSCLFSSYQAARETPGVKDLRTFLGDPENRVVELVVDPELVTPMRLAGIMRPTHHHTP